MTLNMHARLTADGKQAQGSIREVTQEADRLDAGLADLSTTGKKTESVMDRMAAIVEEAGDGLAGAADDAGGVDEETSLAAGSVGNLTAQFNDIGVMLMSGQNPLQLAIQQGTQIGQVIGPMGAAGAARALGSAFMAMLSPVNLITIGSIAAGAALTQWLVKGQEDAEDLTDQLGDLKDMVDAYAGAAQLASSSTREMEERFASAAGEIRGTLQLLEQIAASQAQRKIDEINASISDLMGIAGSGDRRMGVADFFDVNIALAFTQAQRDAREEARQLTAEFVNQQMALAQSSGNLDAQMDALRALLTTTQALAEASGDVSAEEEALIKNLAETLVLMGEQKGAAVELAENLDAVKRIATDILGISGQIDFSTAIIGADVLAARLSRAWSFAAGIAEKMATQQAAESWLSGMENQSDRALYGGAYTSMRDQTQLQNYSPDGRLPAIPAPKPPKAPRAAGGSAREERDAIADLIEKKREELDLLRETDPVQQEMIRLRGELATATDAERAQVEGLIASIGREEQARAQAAETSEFFRSSMADLIPGLVRGGDEAASSWQRFVRVLEDAAWQALLLGQGPLMGLFGGGGSWGGIFGMIGGLFGLADGGGHDRVGMHYGLGGPRADKMPILVSPGEFTVNAKATQQHRALLEAINAGAPIPGFAAGGIHGGGAPILQPTVITQQFINETGVDMRMSREERTQPDGSRLERFVIAEAVSEGLTTRGGAGRRTLQQTFGVQPRRLMR